MNGEKYIFFLDIDGTLFVDGILPERNMKAIRLARKNGHRVFLNTGRATGILPGEIRDILPEFDGAVTALGSNISADGRVIYSRVIPPEELIAAFKRADAAGRKILFEGNDCVIVNSFYADRPDAHTVTETAEEFAEFIKDRDIPKIFIPGVLPADEADYYRRNFTFCQHPTYAEISPGGDTKATAIKKVKDCYAPEKYTSVAVGDSLNDIEMLSAADIAVGMGDSHPDILPLCDIITCAAADGGVAEAIYGITGAKEEK